MKKSKDRQKNKVFDATNETASMTFEELVADVEESVRLQKPNDGLIAIQSYLANKYSPNATQTDLAFILKRIPPTEDKRNISILLARLIGSPEFTKIDQESERAIVELFKGVAEDLLGRKIEGLQTYEAYDSIREVHVNISRSLSTLDFKAVDLSSISSARSDILKVLKDKKLRAYGQPFGIQDTIILTEQSLSAITTLLASEAERQADLYQRLQELKKGVALGISHCQQTKSFITVEAYKLFLAIDTLIPDYEIALRDRLSSRIKPATDRKFNALKSYPLHITNELLNIVIPMAKIGSGFATDVEINLASTEESIEFTESYFINRIIDPSFNFTIQVVLETPLQQLPFMMDITWREFDDTERNEIYEINVKAQSTATDWDRLRDEEPYSTEPVSGDEFIGRARVTSRICALLGKPNPQSCYITGQKRVGKTSLAIAVCDRMESPNTFTTYLEWGSYSHPDPSKTINELGKNILSFIQSHLKTKTDVEFDGALTPLVRVIDQAARELPGTKFILVLDEFDEIHPEMYRMGPIAEAFFANLRTLSSKKNLALVLVGGEKMPFVIGAQGDQLNKFKRESLGTFSLTEEYSDYEGLVRSPSEDELFWSKDAVEYLFRVTNGHPFYTKLICGSIFQQCIESRDNEVSSLEATRAMHSCIEDMDTNAFAHLWKDGINGREDFPEIIELKRCKLLNGLARKLLSNQPVKKESFAPPGLSPLETNRFLDEFCQRGVFDEHQGEFKISMDLFRMWLISGGYKDLTADTLGEELESARLSEEDSAQVTPNEVVALSKKWPVYNGIGVNETRIQAWLDQVETELDKRLLMTLLENTRLLSEHDINTRFREAYDTVKLELQSWFPENKMQVRQDLMVSYCDGEGKSGQAYASRFAKANKISTNCISGEFKFRDKLLQLEENTNVTINGLIIVDDLIGSGDTLSKSVPEFLDENVDLIKDRSMTVHIIVLLATTEGEAKLRKVLAKYDFISLVICENLNDNNYAFTGQNLWNSEEELYRAKELCMSLGVKVAPKTPLGYKNQGLLLVLPDRCPNNSLPILHSNASDGTWNCLFERAKTR